MTKNSQNKKRGFIVLVGVMLSIIILTIAIGVLDISFKEVTFSSMGVNTSDASFAADVGVECALYNDKTTLNEFPIPFTPTPINSCVGQTPTPTGSGNATSATYNFSLFNIGSNGQCVRVTVAKDNSTPPGTTTITAKGYNIGDGSCNSTNPNRVERVFEAAIGGTVGGGGPPPPPPPGNSTLTITLVGSGSVSSNPSGITCGSDCTENYSDGTLVALTPTPAGSSVFGGWTGDSDCGDGSVTMSGARSCTATFNLPSGGQDGTGGTITHVGGYTIHTFTSTGTSTFNPGPSVTSVEALVVAGGGSGGGSTAGGGGGGGVLYSASLSVVANQDYAVTVGTGGAQAPQETLGNNGQNSSFSTLTAIGGGGGGYGSASGGGAGRNGGSGGGGAHQYDGSNFGPGSGTAGQGNIGGNFGTNDYPGGGGGGAGGAGSAPTASKSGNGGPGISSSISGAALFYGGGGGGGSQFNGGSGGSGVGGAGTSNGGAGTAGTANTGGGGGGGWFYSGGSGGAGGSGIVIVRYPTPGGGAPANNPPVANAGFDRAITLPTSSSSASGAGATDSDGTVVSTTWSFISGPGPTPTITNGTTLTPTFSNMTSAGTYVFRLTATDDDSATGTDDMQVVVTAAANVPPVANAGPDKAITLPTSTSAPTGTSATDSDGTVTSTVWSFISGPTTPTITNGTTLTPSFSNMTSVGTYVFRLTATDNQSATGTDDMQVVVSAAPSSFPIIAGTNTSTQSTDSLSHIVNLPSGIASGDLLLVIAAFDGNPAPAPAVSWPAGWTALSTVTGTSSGDVFSIGYKVATSGDVGLASITISTNNVQQSAHQSFRITSYTGAPQAAVNSTAASSASADPPSLSPTWGSQKTLWIAVAATGQGINQGVSTYPGSPFPGTGVKTQAGTDFNGASVANSTANVQAASVDPGAFTLTTSHGWMSATIGLQGI